jgi:recombination protein RecR
MVKYSKPLERLVNELGKLPGIGLKSAQRLAFYILRQPASEIDKLIGAITEVKQKISYCSICYNMTEDDPCSICTDPQRDKSKICVVEDPNSLLTIERTNEYNGLYHVLLGTLSPLDGIGPEQLKIKELLTRIKQGDIKEIIIATSPNVQGESTALYLARLIKPLGIKVTRIALGVPVGSDLEYADEVTMAKAMEGRREL